MLIIAILVGAGQAAVSGLSGFVTDDVELEATAALEEELINLMNDPVYLDGNDLSRLVEVPELPAGLVESLGEYTRVFGPPRNRDELAAVESVGRDGADFLNPFVRYSGGEQKGPAAGRSRRIREIPPRLTVAVSFKRLLESRRGFNNRGEEGEEGVEGDGFGGGPLAHRSRVELRLGRHVTARLATDHDAGEAFAWKPGSGSYGPDFVGSSIQIVDVGSVKELVVGDFTVRLGHGLTVWSGTRRSGAGRDRPEKVRMSGIAAKTGTSEIGYLRGIGVRLGLGKVGTVEVFTAKMKSLDARDTGLHRTEREIQRRERSPGVLQGGSIVLGGPRFRVGFVGTRIGMSSDSTGSEFAFGIISALHVGWAYASIEAGRRTNAPPSWILSTYFRPADWIEIGSRVRHQAGTRRQVRVVPGADRGGAGGANPAWLTTLTLRKSRWRIQAFRDYIVGSSFSTTRWRPEVRITSGVEVKTRFQALRVRALLVRDARDEAILVENGRAVVRGLQAQTTTRSKLQVDIEVNRALSMRLAIAYQVSGFAGTGTAVFHEIRWRPKPALNIAVGVTAFETMRGAPIYAFEPDVGLQYTWSRLDGGGSRAFVLFQLALSRGIDLRFKIGQTAFESERDLGSGPDHIRTDRLRTVTASIQVKI